jgi:SSS family solute:Na+ symporter
MTEALGFLDLAIVLSYFAAVILVGIHFGSKQEKKNLQNYFSGDRRLPWGAVLGSLVATEISAATFLATPGVGFSENMGFLQMGVGSILARIFIAGVFLGAFYKFRYLSIYQYLADRFGGGSQRTAAVFFLLSRLMASAVRLMIAATGLHVILGFSFFWTTAGFAGLCLLYAGWGGIKAVIWTDCVQGIVFLTAAVVMIGVLQTTVGWGEILRVGAETGRLEVFQWRPVNSVAIDSNWFLLMALFGFVNTLAMMGTDHDFTQRVLTCKNVRDARRGVILSGFISIPVASLFLLIGIGLFAYYQQIGEAGLPVKWVDGVSSVDSDRVFPHFIATALPTGLVGLMLCGVLAAAMSSLDSAMAALSSSVVVDLFKPFSKKTINASGQVWIARGCMLLVSIFLVGIAWLLQHGGQFIWLAFKVAGVTYSGLLGVFLVGLLTRRGDDRWNLVAMFSGCACTLILLLLAERGMIQLAWQWPMLFGVILTFLLGVLPKSR